MNKKLLVGFSPLDIDVQSIKEAKELNNGKIVLKGICQRADAVNQNGRIYPRTILEREVENYQKFIRERRALGELDHAQNSVVNLQNVSHLMTSLWWEGDTVMGTIELLDTPMGKIAQTLVESGVKLGISSRAVGSTYEQGDHTFVQDDLVLLTFDLVSDPSTSNAFMLREGKEISENFLSNFNKSDKIDRILTDILKMKK